MSENDSSPSLAESLGISPAAADGLCQWAKEQSVNRMLRLAYRRWWRLVRVIDRASERHALCASESPDDAMWSLCQGSRMYLMARATAAIRRSADKLTWPRWMRNAIARTPIEQETKP